MSEYNRERGALKLLIRVDCFDGNRKKKELRYKVQGLLSRGNSQGLSEKSEEHWTDRSSNRLTLKPNHYYQ